MSKLNPNAQKWVDALRSGKYKQGIGQLRRGDTFCCLGVACDIAREDLKEEWRGEDFDGNDLILPTSVQMWLGMENRSGFIASIGSKLAAMNDRGTSFAEIANLIEDHADELRVSA